MKILYVTFNFNKGGAGKANLAMVNLLRKYNYKVDTLSVKEIFEKRKLVSFLRYFPYLFTRLLSRLLPIKGYYSFHFGGIILPQDIKGYDILILGWLGNSTIDYRSIKEFNGRVFYRLSDEFAINLNGIHYNYNGDKINNFELYISKIFKIINYKSYRYFQVHCAPKITILSPSMWLLNKIKKSEFKFKKHVLLRNPKSNLMNNIENQKTKYSKQEKSALLVSDNLDDFRKGVHRVLKTFNVFKEMGKIKKLYLVGSSNEPNQFNDNDIVTLGFKNINELTKLYCETKYYFHGAYVDNSPNTLIEAILADCVPIIFSDCEGALEYSSFAKERFIVNSEDYSITHEKKKQKKDSITFDGNFSNLFNQL